MSEIITVINMKGGVGKTTLSVNLGYVLTYYFDKKVLLVDIDPQFNATQYLVKQERILKHFETNKTVYDIFVPKKEAEIGISSTRTVKPADPIKLQDFVLPISRWEDGSLLDLIPSSLKLINFGVDVPRGTENLLKKFLEGKCKHYDIIIIDCPPTLSLLTLSAYLASKHYVIPIKPDYLSSLGLPLLERGLGEYKENFGHSINLLGIVFTMKDNKSSVSAEVMQDIKAGGWACFENYSSLSVKVARSTQSLSDFYKYAKNDRYKREFRNIGEELLNKLP
jgi:chromosome partitioning protein